MPVPGICVHTCTGARFVGALNATPRAPAPAHPAHAPGSVTLALPWHLRSRSRACGACAGTRFAGACIHQCRVHTACTCSWSGTCVRFVCAGARVCVRRRLRRRICLTTRLWRARVWSSSYIAISALARALSRHESVQNYGSIGQAVCILSASTDRAVSSAFNRVSPSAPPSTNSKQHASGPPPLFFDILDQKPDYCLK